jgi:hypothetical protein
MEIQVILFTARLMSVPLPAVKCAYLSAGDDYMVDLRVPAFESAEDF